jgi:hypothetical protein
MHMLKELPGDMDVLACFAVTCKMMRKMTARADKKLALWIRVSAHTVGTLICT